MKKPSITFTPEQLKTWISPIIQENALKIISIHKYLNNIVIAQKL